MLQRKCSRLLNVNLLYYLAPSGIEGRSTASEKKMCKESKSVSLVKEETETGLLHNRQRFYENMLVRPRSQLVV